MIKKIGLIVTVIILITGLAYSSALAKIDIGLGAHYNMAVKDIDISSFDKSHLSYIASVRAKAAWFILDGSLDYRPNPGDDISFTLSPRISFLVDILGSGIYGGVGVQKTYVYRTSGTPEPSNLAYILQAGWEISLGALSLSLDAQYESPDFSLDIDPGFITFGARIFFFL
ncbi:hypothetical protein LCGC14_1873920 [marine sediment metagenome]|uniref:Outer membrane protein beta-barrel domain-containing protein n=1 Tax=marine sediment metagenome TaxID=412755 RepID=A0A0F9J2W7_9ZZZZ